MGTVVTGAVMKAWSRPLSRPSRFACARRSRSSRIGSRCSSGSPSRKRTASPRKSSRSATASDARGAGMAGFPPLSEILEEYQLVEAEDRYRLLIDLGRQLEPMPDALKTDATKVRGCAASVWVYPTAQDARLHFLADTCAAITNRVVALIRSSLQDKPASEVAKLDIAEALAPFELGKHLSANRTQGVPNMIALVKETAARYAAAA